MKTLLFAFVAVLAICFVTSANHNRHHGRKSVRDNEDSNPGPGTDIEWPHPGSINDFTVPDEYTNGTSDGDEGGDDAESGHETSPARYHGRNHRRAHKN